MCPPDPCAFHLTVMLLGQAERRHHRFHKGGGENLFVCVFWCLKEEKVQEKYSHTPFTTTSYEATAPLALDCTVRSSPGSAHSEAEPRWGLLLPHLSFSKQSNKPPLGWLVQGLRVNIEGVSGPVV